MLFSKLCQKCVDKKNGGYYYLYNKEEMAAHEERDHK
jgi:hypothetical protein